MNTGGITMYTAEDFNCENADEEMVQYVIDNVDDFEPRYQHALLIIECDRCPLSMADYPLFADIHSAMADWAIDNNVTDEEFDEFDIEEIFG